MSSRIDSSSVQLGGNFILESKVNPLVLNSVVEKEVDPLEEIREKSQEIIANAQKIANEKANSIIDKAAEEASNIIEAAHVKAQQILVDSEVSVRNAQEEGYQLGQKNGYDDGFRQVYEDLNEQIKSVDLIAESSFKVKQEIILSSEKEILELAITISEKILKEYLMVKPETILGIIRAGISNLKDKEEVKVIINPAHAASLYEMEEDFKNTVKGLKSIRIIEDRTVPYDGIMIESADSRIDASVSSQIEQITKEILKEASANPAFDTIPEEIEIKIEEPPKRGRKRKTND